VVEFGEVDVPAWGSLTAEELEACVRKSVAHKELWAWSWEGREGENVTGEPNDDAGRDERSAVRSNGGGVIGGTGDAL
jgi:hypothetical protein